MDLDALRYAPTHEWAKLDGDIVTVGITQFAVEQLTEPTFLDLPKVGKVLKLGEEAGVIESVKSTSGVNAPVAGEVVEVNTKLIDDPATKRKADLSLVNNDPFGEGWMFKVKVAPGTTLDSLLSKADYEKQIAGH
ncbi:glycine cleavage system protein GcvH [Limnoglobus roseus]|uniref:Glycine cleavage system H protein n=1 Tax=Limnoglobus roseus TaxID=2598579 RepID=A0A5C1A251_9BACT|nr:glycine cleavage system protein GcvH [Limnoglobus roseus]QEL13211.1 glycine cleavage system protein GcvH [Limnoglobus roseus]